MAQDQTCGNCGTEYKIKYDKEDVLHDPVFCPFCGEDSSDETEELNFNDEAEEYYDDEEEE